jgi:hypothetical protein
MKKLGVLLLLGLFLISFSSAAITTTLNSPADASISPIPTISFKATANVTSGVGIANMSLFTNSSGSWAIGNTSTSLVLNQTSYYRLDGSTGDIIDSYGSNNGTNYGTTRGVTGIISDSFYFNGGSSNWASLHTSSISTGLEAILTSCEVCKNLSAFLGEKICAEKFEFINEDLMFIN